MRGLTWKTKRGHERRKRINEEEIAKLQRKKLKPWRSVNFIQVKVEDLGKQEEKNKEGKNKIKVK